MDHEFPLLSTIVWAVGIGLLAQLLAHRWRIPAIVLLLFSGIVLGPDVLGMVTPSVLGGGLPILVKLAVAVILFEGALNLRLSALKICASEIRNLVTFGVLITWGLTSILAHYIARLEWSLSILFGALMTVTGPTVVQPLLKRINIPRRIKIVLEGEAILIDPIGAILAVAVLDLILGSSLNNSVGLLSGLWSYLGRLIVGMIVGALMAIILSRLMKIPYLIPAELSNLIVLAGVWVAFGIAERIQSEAGIMASVAMGLVLQREAVPGERQLRHFKESLTTLSISVLFILLAANLRLVSLWEEGLQGILLVILIMFIIRPLSVFISTWYSRLKWREKLLIAWIGPRGIVAASVASLFGLALIEAGNRAGGRFPALTFLAIMMTVTIQGLTASPLAHLLKLHSMAGHKVIIIGANYLGQRIANIIRAHGRPVILIDTNQTLVKMVSEQGFHAIAGNALDEAVLEEAGIDSTETIVAITTNPEVNVLVAQLAREVFAVKRAFPVLNNTRKSAGIKLLVQAGGKLAFGKSIDIFAWEHTPVEEFVWQVPQAWTSSPNDVIQLSDDLLPVIRLRGDSADIVYADQDWQAGDNIVFLNRISIELAQEYLINLESKR